MRIGAPTVSEVDRLERLEGTLLDRAVRHLRIAHLEREHDVLDRVQARQQALLLEHERDFAAEVVETVAPPPVKSASAHPQLARIRSQLAVDQAQQGGLAGAAPSGYLDQIARRDCEIDTLEDAGLPNDLETPSSLTAGSTVSSPLFSGRRLVAPFFCASKPCPLLPFSDV